MCMMMMMCASQPAYQAAYMMKIEINKKNQNKSDEATHVWMQMRKMRIIKENRAFGVTKTSGFSLGEIQVNVLWTTHVYGKYSVL